MLVYPLDKGFRLVGIYFLAIISCKENVAIREHQFFYLAMILAARTGLHLHGRSLGGQHIGQRQSRSLCGAVLGIQRRPVSAHQFRHIGEKDTFARHQLQGTHDGQVFESSALHHNMLTQFADILYFKNFIQTIFHH